MNAARLRIVWPTVRTGIYEMKNTKWDFKMHEIGIGDNTNGTM